MTSARGEHTVKGTHVIVASQFVDEQLGAAPSASSPSLGGQRWAVLLPSSWYELDILHAALAESRVAPTRRSTTSRRRLRRATPRPTSPASTSFVIKALAPQRVLGQLPHLWRFYVRFGECAPASNDKGHYIAEGRGMLDEYAEWAPAAGAASSAPRWRWSAARTCSVQICKPWREPDGSRFRFEISYS